MVAGAKTSRIFQARLLDQKIGFETWKQSVLCCW